MSELVEYVRDLVERQLVDVWVEGEISNLRPAHSGHVYFTLKDAEAQLPVVLFRRQATLLRFRPEDGLHVLARGKVSVYPQRGQLQLVAETLEPVGTGSLQLAFEQLRDRLRLEGLFAEERKQPLPAYPRTVGIVTSPTGAVIRDFLKIAMRRHIGLNVLLYPVSVQGDKAAPEIETALQDLNAAGIVDVIVVARGGGSLEDLGAFNSEQVARAIAASQIPVVSAIGHETDFTIADFVADLRAPTPSAAAELITETQHRAEERLLNLDARLERAMRFRMLQARQQVDSLHAERAEWRVASLLHQLQQKHDEAMFRLEDAMAAQLRSLSQQADSFANRVLHQEPRRGLAVFRTQVVAIQARMNRAMERDLHDAATRFRAASGQLHALSPLAVLERGYALVQMQDGTVVRSTAQIQEGDQVRTRLSDGAFVSTVQAREAQTHKKEKRPQRKRS